MPRSHREALDPDLRRTAWRIGVQTAVLLLGCLVVVGAVVLLSVIQSQEEQLRQSLSAAAVAAAGPHGGDADRDGDRDLSQPRGGIQTAVLHAGQVHTSGQIPTGLPV